MRYFQGRPEVFYEIGGIKNFTKVTGKYLFQGPFLTKLHTVAHLRIIALCKNILGFFLKAPKYTPCQYRYLWQRLW